MCQMCLIGSVVALNEKHLNAIYQYIRVYTFTDSVVLYLVAFYITGILMYTFTFMRM